jgi:hypothetical protein
MAPPLDASMEIYAISNRVGNNSPDRLTETIVVACGVTALVSAAMHSLPVVSLYLLSTPELEASGSA